MSRYLAVRPRAADVAVDARTLSRPTLSMHCRAKGAVTVVFFSGLDDALAVWQNIEAKLGPGAPVCAHDRSGEGASP